MDSGGYFTGLMINGFGLPGQFENQPAQEVVAQDEVEAIGKGIPKRTKNFTIDEDEQRKRYRDIIYWVTYVTYILTTKVSNISSLKLS